MVAPLVLVGLYGLIFLAYLAVPGRWVDGYVRDQAGRPLRYRLNGLRVMLLAIAAWAAIGQLGLAPWDYLYVHRWSTLAAAITVGLVFTFAIVLPAPPVKGLLADLFLGRLENPQLWRGLVDAKMFLYLVGAVMLELNLLSFAAHHVLTYRTDPSPGVLLYVGLFSFFLFEYLWFEEVHLYTYDFFAERVGFKLGWGCLAFYPFFYGVGLWATADAPNPHVAWPWLVAIGLLFFTGWSLARGANMQKFWFKTDPTRRAFGRLEPRVVTDGRRSLLVSGFWGVSRHVNYLGEILMATALALALGHPGSPWPWLYPLYYVALLVPRQIDDDRRCAAKYGALWDDYCKAVPYRIVPGLY